MTLDGRFNKEFGKFPKYQRNVMRLAFREADKQRRKLDINIITEVLESYDGHHELKIIIDEILERDEQ